MAHFGILHGPHLLFIYPLCKLHPETSTLGNNAPEVCLNLCCLSWHLPSRATLFRGLGFRVFRGHDKKRL